MASFGITEIDMAYSMSLADAGFYEDENDDPLNIEFPPLGRTGERNRHESSLARQFTETVEETERNDQASVPDCSKERDATIIDIKRSNLTVADEFRISGGAVNNDCGELTKDGKDTNQDQATDPVVLTGFDLYFPELPQELKLTILEYAVDIAAEEMKAKKIWMVTYDPEHVTKVPINPMLHVSKEARAVALKKHVPFFQVSLKPGISSRTIFVNPRKDTFIFSRFYPADLYLGQILNLQNDDFRRHMENLVVLTALRHPDWPGQLLTEASFFNDLPRLKGLKGIQFNSRSDLVPFFTAMIVNQVTNHMTAAFVPQPVASSQLDATFISNAHFISEKLQQVVDDNLGSWNTVGSKVEFLDFPSMHLIEDELKASVDAGDEA